MGRARRALAASGLLIALALAGCARPVGDFGRAEPDPVHDTVMPALGATRAYLARQPVSAFNLTDQEQEMRNRIWRYLVAPNAFDWFQANLAELMRTGIVPVSDKALLPVDRYYRWLHGQSYASSHTRFARVGDDVTVDIEMMPDAFAAICAVIEVDRERGVAANGVPHLEEAMKADAAKRQVENRTQIGWFVKAVRNRYGSYSYALDHLLVETPHEDAIAVNGKLTELDIYVEAAERGDFCDTSLVVPGDARAPGIPSRVLESGGPPLVARKGS